MAPRAVAEVAVREQAAPVHRVRTRSPRARSEHAHIAGSEAHWLSAGRGDPVVLVHGLGNSSLAWRRVLPGLARGHHVVAPDLPGFGHSSPIDTDDLLDAFSGFVADLAERTGAGVPATIVGNSIGGAIALRMALTRPELVARLVLVDPAGVGQGVPSWWRLVRFEGAVRALSAVPLTVMPRPAIEWVIATAYRYMAFARPERVSDRTVRLFAQQLNSRERIHRFLRNAHSIVDAFERDVQRLERPLPVPVLAIWGRDDRLVPLHDALALLQRIGELEVRILDGCGHSPQLEQPAAFLDAVLPFIDARRPPRAE
jgi:pimeloyl-ACP methyl ester carboxylesterase